jgi:type I restriction enzyme M protein
VLPGIRDVLFGSADRHGYSQLKVGASEIKATIFGHVEFAAFTETVNSHFVKWKAGNVSALTGIKIGDHPKALIETTSESLLDTFKSVPLVDAYDVYQHLMTYWTDTMQDDVYMLAHDGWTAQADGKPNTNLIPSSLVVARYFADDAKAIEQLEADRDTITRQMEELEEEHGGDEGLLAEAKTDKGKLTKVSVKARLLELKKDHDAADERKILSEYLELLEQEAAANRKVKDAQKALDAKVAAQYSKLTETEIKLLVVDDKWLATLAADVQTELDRVSQALTRRIKELADRYATPLPKLTAEVDALAARFIEHLKTMGVASA